MTSCCFGKMRNKRNGIDIRRRMCHHVKLRRKLAVQLLSALIGEIISKVNMSINCVSRTRYNIRWKYGTRCSAGGTNNGAIDAFI